MPLGLKRRTRPNAAAAAAVARPKEVIDARGTRARSGAAVRNAPKKGPGGRGRPPLGRPPRRPAPGSKASSAASSKAPSRAPSSSLQTAPGPPAPAPAPSLSRSRTAPAVATDPNLFYHESRDDDDGGPVVATRASVPEKREGFLGFLCGDGPWGPVGGLCGSLDGEGGGRDRGAAAAAGNDARDGGGLLGVEDVRATRYHIRRVASARIQASDK